MTFYALAPVPFINHLQHSIDAVRQVWYADDSGGAGSLQRVRPLWEELQAVGAAYCYHTNTAKTLLLVNSKKMDEASQQFHGTDIRIVVGCSMHLGSFIGEPGSVEEDVTTRVAERIRDLTARYFCGN